MRQYRLSIVLAAICIAVLSCTGTKPDKQILFNSSDTSDVPYRIPALGAFSDGTLIAISDYRPCRADIGYGKVDLHIRLSLDNGHTWSEEAVLLEGSGIGGAVDCGFGDAAIVCDCESDEVLVITVCGNTVYYAKTTTRHNPNRMAVLRSHDKGNTWEPWKEITEDVYSLFDESSNGPVQSCFATSGKIFQSRIIKKGDYYRIYVALCARPHGNRVIFSDDFGRTWKPLSGADAFPVPNGDEAKCAELPDGSIILSSRAYEGRYFNIFTYSSPNGIAEGEGTWGHAAFSGKDNKGCYTQDNACNGELLIVPAERVSDGQRVNLALQSIPIGPQRKNVSIYYKEVPDASDPTEGWTSEDMASGWHDLFVASTVTSAYSTMVMQKDGLIGFLLEESLNSSNNGYNIVYQTFTISQITNGKYRYSK